MNTSEIARAILDEGLHLAPTARQRRRLALRLTDDPAAYELFLEGVHHLRLATEADYLAARDLLARAVERDPRFVLALVTLASTYSVMALDGYAAPGDTWPESERIVARALAIDAESPDAHAEAASSAFFYRWDWAEAERQWTSAFRLRREVQSEILAACALQKWATGEAEAALELASIRWFVSWLSGERERTASGLRSGNSCPYVDDLNAAGDRVAKLWPNSAVNVAGHPCTISALSDRSERVAASANCSCSSSDILRMKRPEARGAS